MLPWFCTSFRASPRPRPTPDERLEKATDAGMLELARDGKDWS